jgi:3-deoxy-D-manno-octulosonic-acid transferase
VLEPAAFAVPVLFGPRHGASRDALILSGCAAGESVDDEAALAAALVRLFGNQELRLASGNRAAEVVRGGLGAAERSLRVVESLLAIA